MKFCHGPREACGVFGVFGHKDAAKLTYFGLYALQHRGQESAGIVSSTGKSIYEHKGMGLVPEVFNETNLNELHGHIAVGHVRYSTTGSSVAKNAQPFVASHGGKTLAIAHNGNLTNAQELRNDLEKKGSIFQTTMDSEIIVHLLARNIQKGLEEAMVQTVSQIQGSYSCVLMTKEKLIAFRDPNGFRPLCLGLLDEGYIVASETCALDLIEAQHIRDIDPGEILIIGKDELKSIKPFPERTQEYPIAADFAMPFPDSGNYAAIGFCQESGIPLEMGVIRNHYVGRTFIEPIQSMRDFEVKVKLNPVKEILNQKRVVIIEDSIVRATTSKMRIKTLREAGAWEIHMVVSCPPLRHPCYYGIDFSTSGELIAAQHSVEEIKNFIGLDSLCYLSLPGMLEAVGLNQDSFCLACFNGKYPIQPKEGFSKLYLES
jgi:amidophosphoribosyltransferase